jgi:hypothetical protein
MNIIGTYISYESKVPLEIRIDSIKNSILSEIK